MGTTKPKDYYSILGINQNATKEEIKSAYRSLIRKWHPDVCKAPNAHIKTAELSEAYAILSNDKARAEYHDNLREYAKWQREGSYKEGDGTFKDQEQERAREQAEQYANMSLSELLSGALDNLLYGKKDGRKSLNMIDYQLLGIKVWICVGLGALAFTFVFIPITIIFGQLVIKGLFHKGRFVGFIPLIQGAILVAVEVIIIFIILMQIH